jgi:hypothetical protein
MHWDSKILLNCPFQERPPLLSGHFSSQVGWPLNKRDITIYTVFNLWKSVITMGTHFWIFLLKKTLEILLRKKKTCIIYSSHPPSYKATPKRKPPLLSGLI